MAGHGGNGLAPPSPVPITEFSELLYEALHSEHGIWIRVNDVARAKNKLAAERAKLDDPDLACLTFRQSPLEGDVVWVMKESAPDESSTDLIE